MASGADGLAEIEVDIVGGCIEFRGQEGVVGVLHSGPDGVANIGVEGQAGLESPVVDAAPESEREAVLAGLEGELIVAVGGGRREESLVADDVVPPRSDGSVAPGNPTAEVARAGPEVEHVPTEVSAQVKLVLGRGPPIDLGIEVIEIIARPGEGTFRIHERLGEHVDVGPASTDDEAGGVLDQRGLHGQAGADQPEAATDSRSAGIALFQSDVQDRGDPAPEPGGHGAFCDLDVLDGIGVEHTEEAKQVGGVVDNGVIDEHQILVGSPASDVEAGIALARTLYARKELDHLEHIHLTKQGGEGLDRLHAHVGLAHVGAFRVGRALGLDLRGGHRDDVGPQFDVEGLVLVEGQRPGLGDVPDERPVEPALSSRKSQAVESVGVGGRPNGFFLYNDRRPEDVFAGLGIDDTATEGHLLGTEQTGQGEKKKKKARGGHRGGHRAANVEPRTSPEV